MTGFSGNGEGGITQGATENIFSISNATSWVKGAPQHPLRSPGAVPQVRAPHRGAAARRLHFQRAVHRQPGRRFPARLLLDVHRRVRQLAIDLPLADLRAVHRRQLADQSSRSRCRWASGGSISGRGTRATASRARSTRRPGQDRAITSCRPSCPPQLVPLIINQDNYFPAGHPAEGPEQLGSARRSRLQRQRPDGRADRIRRLLRQPESQRAAVLAAGAAVLRPVLAPADADGSQLQCRHAVSGSEQHPAVPGAVLDGSRPTAAPTRCSGTPTCSARSAATTWSKWPTPAAAATTSTSATTSTRRSPGTTPIVTRVPYPAFQSAILYSSDAGWARFNGLSFRAEKRYSDGLFFLGNYQISKSTDNGSGEIEANDTAFAWDLNADEGPARYDQRHRAGDQRRLRAAVRAGQARGCPTAARPRTLLGGWQVQGIVRLGVGIPVHRDVDQRLPVRLVRAAARELRARPRRGRRQARQSARRDPWFDPDGVRRAGARHAGHCRPQHRPRARHRSASTSRSASASRSTRRASNSGWEVFNLLNHTNFGNPDSNISNATVGTITTADDGRNMQFGLRFVW